MTIYGASRLAGCHGDLIRIVTEVGKTRNVQVVAGARSVADELEAIRTGHSSLKDPMHSKHVVDPVKRPSALAVDLAPWPLNWQDIAAFDALAPAVKAAAAALGIAITWGGDWTTFKDRPHYELAGRHINPC